MNTTTTTGVGTDPTVGTDAPDVATCACHVYDAECALHAAHQAGVESWITAAGNRLHVALETYLRALDERTRHDTSSTISLPCQTGQQ